MLDNSKLSSRFKQNDDRDEKSNNQHKKFVLEKNTERNVLNKTALVENEAIKKEQQDTDESALTCTNRFDEDEFKKALLDKVDSIPVWFEYTADRQKSLIKSFVEKKIISENLTLSDEQKETLIDKLFTSIMGFGPLDYLIARENVDAVFVNGTNSVHIEIYFKYVRY